jgi:hypothetical protein
MSSNQPPLLIKAKQQESEYDWLAAAESYQKALGSVPEQDYLQTAQNYEWSAHAFYRAAMQANTPSEFKERLEQAVEGYGKARGFYGKSEGVGRTPRSQRCRAMEALLGFWLATETPERKRLIDESWTLTKESLRGFQEVGEALEYCRTYNQLSAGAAFHNSLEWDFDISKKTMGEAVEYGEQSIKLLSTTQAPYELAKAYAVTACYLEFFGYVFLNLGERDSSSQKASQYWLKAKELSEKTALLEMSDFCSHPLSDCLGFGHGTDRALAAFSTTLELAKKTGDRFVIGATLGWLAFHVIYKSEAVEDPDERRELNERALRYLEEANDQYSRINFSGPIIGHTTRFWSQAPYAEYYLQSSLIETEPRKKLDMLQKAIEAAPELLKRAQDSGFPNPLWYARNVTSRVLVARAAIEPSQKEKKKFLEEALEHRKEATRLSDIMAPSFPGRLDKIFLAETQSQLAELGKDPEAKKKMLEEAVQGMEEGLKSYEKFISYQTGKNKFSDPAVVRQAHWYSELGDILNRLYETSNNPDNLSNAAEAFLAASEIYWKSDLAVRVAECNWRAASAYDSLEEHLKAAELFLVASKNYTLAAEKIPQLKELYKDYASYMEAWSQIEKARNYHARRDYDSAKKFYEAAADLHKSTKEWSYLAQNYSAWAKLEEAEDLARIGHTQESIPAYKEASRLFGEAKDSLQAELGTIKKPEEKQTVTRLSKAADIRQEYCSASITLEEAKALEKEGDNLSSSEKYGKVAEKLERIVGSLELEQDQREIKYCMTLAKARQMMRRADVEASPGLYLEAAELYEKAKELSHSEQGKIAAMGHSRFCRALEVGAKFEDSRDVTLHSAAMEHLESASNHFLKAGFQDASEYAEASKLLFDAYACLDRANKETDQEKKAKMYLIAEKVLQTSADYYARAEHPAKRDQVLRLLEKVKKGRELAVSLTEIFSAPSRSIFPPSIITTPTTTQEKATGLERFEHANVQANVIASRKSLTVGESLELEVELVNSGKGPAQLIKLEELAPEGFELTGKPERYRVDEGYLNMKGRRLDPLKTEEIKLILKPKIQGQFTLKPRILYLDESGGYKSHEPEPLKITVTELGIKGWIKGR